MVDGSSMVNGGWEAMPKKEVVKMQGFSGLCRGFCGLCAGNSNIDLIYSYLYIII